MCTLLIFLSASVPIVNNLQITACLFKTGYYLQLLHAWEAIWIFSELGIQNKIIRGRGGAEYMAQKLRALTALPGDLSSCLRIHMVAHKGL